MHGSPIWGMDINPVTQVGTSGDQHVSGWAWWHVSDTEREFVDARADAPKCGSREEAAGPKFTLH